MLLTFGFVAAFVGMDITPEQSLTTFPEIETARMVENSLYLGVLLLWLIYGLGLYRTLRRTSPTTLADLLATGQVTPVIDRTHPLDEAADALRYVGAGHTRGKVVVTV